MPIPTYTLGYPPDGSSLGQTKSTIRNNLDGTFETLAVDHINNNGQPGTNPAGYHNVIHSVPQGSNPGAIAGFGQLFSKSVSSVITDTALFWETGTGLIQQLTANITPSIVPTGYTFIPGGVLVQWGGSASGADNQLVAFPLAFPTSVFTLQITPYNTTSTITSSSSLGTVTLTNFVFRTASSNVKGFFWFAIGN